MAKKCSFSLNVTSSLGVIYIMCCYCCCWWYEPFGEVPFTQVLTRTHFMHPILATVKHLNVAHTSECIEIAQPNHFQGWKACENRPSRNEQSYLCICVPKTVQFEMRATWISYWTQFLIIMFSTQPLFFSGTQYSLEPTFWDVLQLLSI